MLLQAKLSQSLSLNILSISCPYPPFATLHQKKEDNNRRQLWLKELKPERYKEDIQQQAIRMQDYIAAALKQGEEINEEEWEKLAHAPDINTVLKVLREDVKGKPPRKGSLQLWMDDLGSMWATFEGEKFFVGSLEVDSDEEAVQKAIERIKKGAGIL